GLSIANNYLLQLPRDPWQSALLDEVPLVVCSIVAGGAGREDNQLWLFATRRRQHPTRVTMKTLFVRCEFRESAGGTNPSSRRCSQAEQDNSQFSSKQAADWGSQPAISREPSQDLALATPTRCQGADARRHPRLSRDRQTPQPRGRGELDARPTAPQLRHCGALSKGVRTYVSFPATTERSP